MGGGQGRNLGSFFTPQCSVKSRSSPTPLEVASKTSLKGSRQIRLQLGPKSSEVGLVPIGFGSETTGSSTRCTSLRWWFMSLVWPIAARSIVTSYDGELSDSPLRR